MDAIKPPVPLQALAALSLNEHDLIVLNQIHMTSTINIYIYSTHTSIDCTLPYPHTLSHDPLRIRRSSISTSTVGASPMSWTHYRNRHLESLKIPLSGL
jgi:hypothetical protein